MYSSNAQPTGTNKPKACHNKSPTHTTNKWSNGTHRARHTNVFASTMIQRINRPPHPTTPTHRGTGQGPRGHRVTAAIAAGKHPVPYRTRKLSLPAPMVLQPRGCGRVGRRRTNIDDGPSPSTGDGPSVFLRSPISAARGVMACRCEGLQSSRGRMSTPRLGLGWKDVAFSGRRRSASAIAVACSTVGAGNSRAIPWSG